MSKKNTRKDIFSDTYKPQQAVTGRKLINENAQNLIVIFPPWHNGGKAYPILINRLAKNGNAVLAYYFHDEILKPNAKQVLQSYEHMGDLVAAELEKITSNSKYHKVTLLALSLGTPGLSIVTSRFNRFDSVIFVPGASSLARCAWYGSRTQHICLGIESQGINLPQLEAIWSELAPSNNIKYLEGKDVNLVISLKDSLIPTPFQLEFLNDLRTAGLNPKVLKSNLGHYAIVCKFCLFGKV